MSRYHPTYLWFIDWNGDGNYTHPHAEVTDAVWTWSVTFGCRPNLDASGVAVAHALGDLVLVDKDGAYNADSPNAVVAENLLRRRNAVKLEVDGVLAWCGFAEPTSRNAGTGGFLGWQLVGKHSDVLTRGERELDLPAGTVAGVAQAFTAASGIDLHVASTQATGLVVFRGSWLYLLQDLAAFAGGWILEDKDGSYLFRQWTATPGLPLAASLDLSYGPSERGLLFSERVKHTRNFAVCRALVWAAAETATLAFTTVTMGPNEQRWVPLIFEPTRSARPSTWSTFDLSDDANFSILGNAKRISDNVYNVRVQSGAFAGQKSVTVTATGTAEKRREAAERKLRINDYNTQTVYGERPLRLPPWFPADYDGLHTHTTPWLRNLSQPPQHLRVTYPEFQDTAGRHETLRDAVLPGRAVDCTVVVDGSAVTVPILVLAVRIAGGARRAPMRTVWGIRRQAVPQAPLGVDLVDVADVSANAVVGVPTPNGQTVYARHRTAA